MRNFQEAYKEALDGLPRKHFDAEKLSGGVVRKRVKRSVAGIWLRGAAAAVILALCSVGTVTAVNYSRSRIRVGQQGYFLTGGETREPEEAAKGRAAEEISGEAASGRAAEEISGEAASGRAAEEISGEAASGRAADEASGFTVTEEPEEQREYGSVAAFREKERIVMALPKEEWFGGTDGTWDIYVLGDGANVTARFCSGEEEIFTLHQWDTRGAESYGAAAVYEGESANERSFTSSQGLSYVVFDSVEEQEILSTHALISVNGRELTLDFYGYEAEVVEKVLDELDLNVYFDGQ